MTDKQKVWSCIESHGNWPNGFPPIVRAPDEVSACNEINAHIISMGFDGNCICEDVFEFPF